MKRYTAAVARKRFSSLLDAAERGESVVIERQGVCFRVQPDRQANRKRTQRSCVVELTDAAVLRGEWSWEWKATGLGFVSKRQRTRR